MATDHTFPVLLLGEESQEMFSVATASYLPDLQNTQAGASPDV